MRDRRLGRTGVLVGELGLGTMTFGGRGEGWRVDETTSHQILDRFVASGGNLIDTADVYSSGRSEEIIGTWLAHQDREELVLATKARFRTGPGPNRVGLSRKHLLNAVRESLRRLRTDHVDLYQVHAWDPWTPLEETFGTLNGLVEDGLVRYVGVSNFRGWQLEKALTLCRQRSWAEPVSLQPQYSLYARATEFELLPLCAAEGLAVLPWSPLASGVLSGKYANGVRNPPAGSRIANAEDPGAYAARFDNDRVRRILSSLNAVAKEVGRTPAQVALNWLLSRPAVTAPILGARSVEQLEEDLGATGWSLSPEQRSALDAASELEVTYPYDRRAEEQQTADRSAP
jgi:aryl-alcohol dehydrogenase-like predicted oxidoreductase